MSLSADQEQLLFGDMQLEGELGEGGMGKVQFRRSNRTGERFAVKWTKFRDWAGQRNFRMEPIHPVVRHLIACDDILHDPDNPRRVTLVNIVHAIRSLEQPPFPLRHRELCVLVQVTECRGTGEFRIEIVQADTGRVVRRTGTRSHDFGNDPLEVFGLPFRIQDCPFPEAGLYWIQFWLMTI